MTRNQMPHQCHIRRRASAPERIQNDGLKTKRKTNIKRKRKKEGKAQREGTGKGNRKGKSLSNQKSKKYFDKPNGNEMN